jgi:hypothetical protein
VYHPECIDHLWQHPCTQAWHIRDASAVAAVAAARDAWQGGGRFALSSSLAQAVMDRDVPQGLYEDLNQGDEERMSFLEARLPLVPSTAGVARALCMDRGGEGVEYVRRAEGGHEE